MSASISFTTIRTCKVDVQYLRGRKDGHDGFWIVETSHAERYDSTSFQRIDALPADHSAIGALILAYDDAEHQGITGKDCPVRKIGGDKDSALYVVTANVQKRSDLVEGVPA